jgi:hypothetical protein
MFLGVWIICLGDFDSVGKRCGFCLIFSIFCSEYSIVFGGKVGYFS